MRVLLCSTPLLMSLPHLVDRILYCTFKAVAVCLRHQNATRKVNHGSLRERARQSSSFAEVITTHQVSKWTWVNQSTTVMCLMSIVWRYLGLDTQCGSRVLTAEGEVKSPPNFHFSSSGFLSTSMWHRAAGDNIEQPPKFVPPSKPVIVDKTQTVASMRK